MKQYIYFAILIMFMNLNCFEATRGVDLSQSFTNFQCMKSSGQKFVIVRAYQSFGQVDNNAVKTLQAAKKVGLITDIYHFPCVGKISATNQANDVIKKFTANGKDLYGTVWIDVEHNPSKGCTWASQPNTNCNFMKNIVKAYKDKGKKVGIYASKEQWKQIFGGEDKCANFKDLPVWYAHYDNEANFNDWKNYKFGGWDKPDIKQYAGTKQLCGVGVDLNFY